MKRADDGHQHQRKRQGRAGAGTAGQRGVGDDEVDQRRIHHAGCVEFLAGHGRADDGEDARADDRADAERGQRPRPEGLLEPVLGSSDSLISLSIDLRASSWLGSADLLEDSL